MFKKRELLLFFRDRIAATLLILMVLGTLLLVGMTILNLRVSDVQIPIRYTDYGFTNLYRDRWYALASFGLFGLIVTATNGYLAIKLHSLRRGMSLGILAIGLLTLIITLIVANAVFGMVGYAL